MRALALDFKDHTEYSSSGTPGASPKEPLALTAQQTRPLR